MRERDIEKYLVAQVKLRGGEVRKMAWIGRRGAPDRFVLLNGGHFVELKRPGGKPRPEQVREHDRLAKHGVHVTILDTLEGVDKFIKEIS